MVDGVVVLIIIVKVGRDVEDESEVGEVIASANCISFAIVVGRAKRNYRAGLK